MNSPQDEIEYLRTEKQILREIVGKKRGLLSDEQRRGKGVRNQIMPFHLTPFIHRTEFLHQRHRISQRLMSQYDAARFGSDDSENRFGSHLLPL